MSRIIFPEWRVENSSTTYPFAAEAVLANASVFIPPDVFLDAILYPVGGSGTYRLSQVEVAYNSVTLWIGDDLNAQLASGTFTLPATSEQVALFDAAGMSAGLLVAVPAQLDLFLSWGVGLQSFTAAQAAFAATVCVATPGDGVTGLLLDDGTLLTGEVWLVGGDGVVLRHETVNSPDPAGGTGGTTNDVIRVDVVGDPLFRRRLCLLQELFSTPRLLQSVTFADKTQTVTVYPDGRGNISVTANNAIAEDTVLRIRPTAQGNIFEAVGSPLTTG